MSIGPRPVSCVVTGAECSAPGQEAPIPHDDRNGGRSLQERGQGAGIHDIGEVVANETAGIQLLTGEVAEMLLRGCERAVEVDGEDGAGVGDGRKVEPEKLRPPPGEDGAGRDKQDEVTWTTTTRSASQPYSTDS